MLPFCEAKELPVLRMPTGYYGKADIRDYQLYLAVNEIDHITTQIKSPQTNGNRECFHKTGCKNSIRWRFE
ncbi:MAG: hypothetical protein DWQ08_08010 [Proteobacteria bacterium]|nr:MAG: hypothetical protein DWQ08_08010 [Pseudomonadota bacterium]